MLTQKEQHNTQFAKDQLNSFSKLQEVRKWYADLVSMKIPALLGDDFVLKTQSEVLKLADEYGQRDFMIIMVNVNTRLKALRSREAEYKLDPDKKTQYLEALSDMYVAILALKTKMVAEKAGMVSD